MLCPAVDENNVSCELLFMSSECLTLLNPSLVQAGSVSCLNMMTEGPSIACSV